MRNQKLPCVYLCSAAFLAMCCCTVGTAEEQPGTVDVTNQAQPNSSPGNAVADPGDTWHTALTLYLWFPGVHGTLGNGVRNVDFRASPSDLLSNFRFGLMGAGEIERRGYVLMTDLLWVRLRSTNTTTLPFPGVPTFTAEAKGWQLILTPEVGYRFLNREKVKIDALMGVRYWHLGSSLQFTPSLLGFTFSGSQNWVDPLMGTRIQFALSPKLSVNILGDGGGWGAGSQLDYQIVGTIGYKLTAKFTVGGGYRYLHVNYRSSRLVYDTTMSGVIVGINYAPK
jgi:hypothetical protein